MNSDGEYKTFRALLDPGSQTPFITEEWVQSLNLPLQEYSASIQGISQTSVLTIKGIINCCIKPRFKNHPYLKSYNAVVLPCITALLPSTSLPVNVRDYKNLKLADPYFVIHGKIDFLLGADLFLDIFDGGQKRAINKGILSAYHTIFG